MDAELERISKELQQLNNSLEDTLNIYINKMSRLRPTYTTSRPTFYEYKEGYTVETSARHPSHYYLLNRRRNLPVRPSWKKNNGHEVYTPPVKKRNPLTKLQNKKNHVTEAFDAYYTPGETECSCPHTPPNASINENYLPRAYTPKLSSTKSLFKRPKKLKPVDQRNHYHNDIDTSKNETSSTENENKTYSYCQQLAEINEPESDQKMNEEIINDLAIPEEIVEDKALEKDDQEILIKVEGGSNERKNSDQHKTSRRRNSKPCQ
ncbi:hypothetical protein C2G38_2281700 [Gigaspora rosea]|uniref:Uncharacterized protein n=1 Tax=Gigaspora rosea TaxID=44941 RepID=A0A397U4C3_9GLOM|nr:hypothetical protein C2G38_2281700 [Gigaspora rosea]